MLPSMMIPKYLQCLYFSVEVGQDHFSLDSVFLLIVSFGGRISVKARQDLYESVAI